MRWPGASEQPLGSPIRDAAANGEVHFYSNEANLRPRPIITDLIPLSSPRLPTTTVRAASRLYG